MRSFAFVCFSLTAAVDSGTKRLLREEVGTKKVDAGAGASLAQCVLPAAPADPSTRRSSFTESDADGPGSEPDDTLFVRPGPPPYDTVFTEYDFYATSPRMSGFGEDSAFADYEPAKLEHCEVSWLEGNPSLKWELHECEILDGALALHPLTIELKLSDCKGAPLTSSMFKPWVSQKEHKDALDVAMQKRTSRPFEKNLMNYIGSFVDSPDADHHHRGRAVYIANCPLGDDPDLFPVLLRSLCDFTLYDPRPEFQGTFLDRGGAVRSPTDPPAFGKGQRTPLEGACHGPFKVEVPRLTLAEVELSADQLEALFSALLPNQALILSRVTITGTPGPHFGEVLARTVSEVGARVPHRGGSSRGNRGGQVAFLQSCDELSEAFYALRGGGPSQHPGVSTETTEAVFAAIQGCLSQGYPDLEEEGKQYVRWFTGRVADSPEYTTQVVFMAAPPDDDDYGG